MVLPIIRMGFSIQKTPKDGAVAIHSNNNATLIFTEFRTRQIIGSKPSKIEQYGRSRDAKTQVRLEPIVPITHALPLRLSVDQLVTIGTLVIAPAMKNRIARRVPKTMTAAMGMSVIQGHAGLHLMGAILHVPGSSSVFRAYVPTTHQC